MTSLAALALLGQGQCNASQGILNQLKNWMTSSYETFLGNVEEEHPLGAPTVNRFGNTETLLHHSPEEGRSKKLISMDASPRHFAFDYKQ